MEGGATGGWLAGPAPYWGRDGNQGRASQRDSLQSNWGGQADQGWGWPGGRGHRRLAGWPHPRWASLLAAVGIIVTCGSKFYGVPVAGFIYICKNKCAFKCHRLKG